VASDKPARNEFDVNSSRIQHQEGAADPGAAAMAELFRAIGFEVGDEAAYNRLVEYVENNGLRSQIGRGEALLHGRCLKLGDGLEVWSVLFERGSDFYYADCRPGFRSRYVLSLSPWELIEYDEDGEALVRGALDDGFELVFELQNLTETTNRIFRDSRLRVALGGLAYWAECRPSAQGFQKGIEAAERISDYAQIACESDYVINGSVAAVRQISNPLTGATLCWMLVDTGIVRLGVLANQSTIRGSVSIGSTLTAGIWLQGHILADDEVRARYEGVDPDHEAGDSWIRLRRGN
jgi:hypothetical protein